MDVKRLQDFLSTGASEPVQDEETPLTDLQKHDKRFHPNGFDPKKDKCRYREAMAKLDKTDKIVERIGEQIPNYGEHRRRALLARAEKIEEAYGKAAEQFRLGDVVKPEMFDDKDKMVEALRSVIPPEFLDDYLKTTPVTLAVGTRPATWDDPAEVIEEDYRLSQFVDGDKILDEIFDGDLLSEYDDDSKVSGWELAEKAANSLIENNRESWESDVRASREDRDDFEEEED